MGETTAETVKEIEATRDRLGDEIQALQDRLPSPAVVAKTVARKAAVASGAAGGVVALVTVRRLARRRRAKRARATLAGRVGQVVPERWMGAFDAGYTRPWAFGMGAAFMLLQIIELRRLRALRNAVASR